MSDNESELILRDATEFARQVLLGTSGDAALAEQDASAVALVLLRAGLLKSRLGSLAPAMETESDRNLRIARCVETGGHCYVESTADSDTSRNAQPPDQCRHCPSTRPHQGRNDSETVTVVRVETGR